MKLFIAGCPEETELDDWRDEVERICDMDSTSRKSALKILLERTTDGIRFKARIFLDSTFELTDGYVTVVMGELNSFRTTTSDKPRVIPLAYMIHTDKLATTHEAFANWLTDKFNAIGWGGRRCPCLLVDGEAALVVYAEKLDTDLVRCDVHIMSLMQHKYGKKVLDSDRKLLFGECRNDTWKRGLLGSFSEADFDESLKKVETKLSPNVSDWVKRNRFMLILNASVL